MSWAAQLRTLSSYDLKGLAELLVADVDKTSESKDGELFEQLEAIRDEMVRRLDRGQGGEVSGPERP